MKEELGPDGAMKTSSVMLSPTRWPLEFEKKQQEIIQLWQACQVALVHRTYFFLLFKGDPADSIYMEVELRRLSFVKGTYFRGSLDGKAVLPGVPKTSLGLRYSFLSLLHSFFQKKATKGKSRKDYRREIKGFWCHKVPPLFCFNVLIQTLNNKSKLLISIIFSSCDFRVKFYNFLKFISDEIKNTKLNGLSWLWLLNF